MRVGIDIGGTCTDFVVEMHERLFAYKYPTSADLISGIMAGFTNIATEHGVDVEQFFSSVDSIVHGTTVATNALISHEIARTALMTTLGHRDVLVLREAGRFGLPMFNTSIKNPQPYVPRSLTYAVDERILFDGTVAQPLDESTVLPIIEQLIAADVEAVAVCLLWSIVNPVHERRIGELLEQHAPDLNVSLSHQVNPCLREYRRASSTAMDASLTPRVAQYIEDLEGALQHIGFSGELWFSTSEGTVCPARRAKPIHLVRSGPALGPVAAAKSMQDENIDASVAILIDAGGTTLDYSLLLNGQAGITQETWIGRPYIGHMTGFPAIDVRSIGAGGGSIAYVENQKLVRVGPQSTGANPGPASYGKGGTRATVTDALVLLGLQDVSSFVPMSNSQTRGLAKQAIDSHISSPLGVDSETAACAILSVFIENAASSISEITIQQGVDPRGSTLVATGGLAGMVAVMLANRLGCTRVLFPASGAVNCAAGALLSNPAQRFSVTRAAENTSLELSVVEALIEQLNNQCRVFAEQLNIASSALDITYSVVAKYQDQQWEIAVPFDYPLPLGVETLTERFHVEHERYYQHEDRASPVSFLTWQALATHTLDRTSAMLSCPPFKTSDSDRRMLLPGAPPCTAKILNGTHMTINTNYRGPMLVETPLTTLVVDKRSKLRRTEHNAYVVELF